MPHLAQRSASETTVADPANEPPTVLCVIEPNFAPQRGDPCPMDRLHPSAVDAHQRQCTLVPDVCALVSLKSRWLVTPGRRVLCEPLCASQGD